MKDKPYLKAPADDLNPQAAANIAWENHKKRNASIMVELFDVRWHLKFFCSPKLFLAKQDYDINFIIDVKVL